MDFLDFAFLCVTLKVDPTRSTSCVTLKVDPTRSTSRREMVDSAFDRVWSNVYDHVMFG